MIALKILDERLQVLSDIFVRMQSTEALADLKETKEAIEELENIQIRLYHAEGYIKDLHEPKD